MAIDPVCQMQVDETKAEYHTSLGGKTYFFCSEKCQEEFENNPEQYVNNAA